MYRKYMIILIIIVVSSAIYMPKTSAENIAVKYMKINKIYNDESYQVVKSRIYNISSDNVKNYPFQI